MGNWDCPPCREEEKLRRLHERVRRKWREKKVKAKPCPNCECDKIGLNDSLLHRWKRFYLVCENCHWCGKRRPTIGAAVRAWNRDNVEKYMYKRKGLRNGKL